MHQRMKAKGIITQSTLWETISGCVKVQSLALIIDFEAFESCSPNELEMLIYMGFDERYEIRGNV